MHRYLVFIFFTVLAPFAIAQDIVEPRMVAIPGGNFTMGHDSSSSTAAANYPFPTPAATPSRRVEVAPFWLAAHEVTVGEFRRFVEATGYRTRDVCLDWNRTSLRFPREVRLKPGSWSSEEYAPSEFHPVLCVSWDDAVAYASWLTEKTGLAYRLPSEAEWEYAARAWDEAILPETLCSYGNGYDENGKHEIRRRHELAWAELDCADGAGFTNVVGMYLPNRFGVFDLLGNVSEWVEDCEHPDYDGAPTNGAAWTTDCKGGFKIHRGGSYASMAAALTPHARAGGWRSNSMAIGTGFRLALDFAELPAERSPTVATQEFAQRSEAAQQRKRERHAQWLREQGPIQPEMVVVAGGVFRMGSDGPESAANERPVHEVSVASFKLSKYEVTVEEFRRFVEATGYPVDDTCWNWDASGATQAEKRAGGWDSKQMAPSGRHPVMCVSWKDAHAYLDWLSNTTGKRYRLPTEAEWEYAARAGERERPADRASLCERGNLYDQYGFTVIARDHNVEFATHAPCNDGAAYTAPVGSYRANALGVFDMLGNVAEYVADCEHQNYTGAPADGSAWSVDCSGPFSKVIRRGGAYGSEPKHVRVSARGHASPDNTSALGDGFRIAQDMQ